MTRIGPVAVAELTVQAAVARVSGMVSAGVPGMVAFANAHSVNLARRNPAFAQAMAGALVLNDGIGVDLARRVLRGAPFPANLNGTDFTPTFLDAIDRPLRIALLGSRPDVLPRAADAFVARFPRHQVVVARHGYFSVDEAAHVRETVAAARPDLILVGMGQPRQELWAATDGASVPAVSLCIGAYLDFLAGAVPRAPASIRALRMEWLFRLAVEPRRLAGRYLIGNGRFLLDVAKDRLRGRPAA